MSFKPIILVLEDDDNFREKLIPRMETHFKGAVRILTATTVDQAERLLEEHGQSVAVLVTDVMMPNGEPAGIEVAARYSVSLPVIVISAFAVQSFGRDPQTLGVTAYLEKSTKATFFRDLMLNIEEAIEAKEQPSLALSRERGAAICVRFRLSDLRSEEISRVDLRTVDFQAIAYGTREWQAAIESAEGRLSALYGQCLHGAFLDQQRNQDSVRRAVDVFVNACDRTAIQYHEGFDRCPFGAAIVTGVLSSGLFGLRPPGLAAIVGRLADVAQQLATTTKGRELAVLPDSLAPENLRHLKKALGEADRTELVAIANLIEPVNVSYYRWQPGDR